ncbi:hypothetical protein N7522_013673 [Penicillium canescens]|nr:hypothetical protein N7522_013673 [Penicillium canescens]
MHCIKRTQLPAAVSATSLEISSQVVLRSEHPDFPEPVAQLRPISISIHPLSGRAPQTRPFDFPLPFPTSSPLYSLSFNPVKVPAPHIPSRELRPRPQTSRLPSPSIPYNHLLVAFTTTKPTHTVATTLLTAPPSPCTCAIWQLAPSHSAQLRVDF